MDPGRGPYSDVCSTGCVDPVHVFAELRTVTVSVFVVLGHKQKGVNHFMEESLREKDNSVNIYASKDSNEGSQVKNIFYIYFNQVLPRSQLQQRFTKSDGTQSTSALVRTHTSTP